MSTKQWGHGFNTGKEKGAAEGYYKRMTDEGVEHGDEYMTYVLPEMIATISQKIIDDIVDNKIVTPSAHFLAKSIVRILASSC